MKRTTLTALGIAGALVCGSSSAATFLCTQNQSNGSTVSCAEVPSEVLGSMTSGEDAQTLATPSVTYYLVPLDPDQVAVLEPFNNESPAYSTGQSATNQGSADQSAANQDSSDPSSADQWQHSEPRSMTYNRAPDA